MFVPVFLIILILLIFCYVYHSYNQKVTRLKQAILNLENSQKYILTRMVTIGKRFFQLNTTDKNREQCTRIVAREIMFFLYQGNDYIADYAAVCEIVPSFFPSDELDNQRDSLGYYPVTALRAELSNHLYLIWNS